MSAKIMADVLLKSNAKGNAKLVLLTIAYYAHDDGTGARPSLTTLTQHTGLSRRTICAMLDYLSTTGQLHIDSTQGKHGTNLYAIPALGQNLPQTSRAKSAPLGQGLPLKQTEKEKRSFGAAKTLGQILPQTDIPLEDRETTARKLGLSPQDTLYALCFPNTTTPEPSTPAPIPIDRRYLGASCKKNPAHVEPNGQSWRIKAQCVQCVEETTPPLRAGEGSTSTQ
jgi:hypothetical protein